MTIYVEDIYDIPSALLANVGERNPEEMLDVRVVGTKTHYCIANNVVRVKRFLQDWRPPTPKERPPCGIPLRAYLAAETSKSVVKRCKSTYTAVPRIPQSTLHSSLALLKAFIDEDEPENAYNLLLLGKIPHRYIHYDDHVSLIVDIENAPIPGLDLVCGYDVKSWIPILLCQRYDVQILRPADVALRRAKSSMKAFIAAVVAIATARPDLVASRYAECIDGRSATDSPDSVVYQDALAAQWRDTEVAAVKARTNPNGQHRPRIARARRLAPTTITRV